MPSSRDVRRPPGRRSIRLQSHDYSLPGPYFITICTWKRRRLFGRVVDRRIELSQLGQVAHQRWLALPETLGGVAIDEFVVMPDHLHGIVWLPAVGRRTLLSSVVRRFKQEVTQWSNSHLGVQHIWHRNYHERIVRDRRALEAIRRYIIANPAKWSCAAAAVSRRSTG